MPLTRDLRQNDIVVGSVTDSVPAIDAEDLRNVDAGRRSAVVASISAACRETGFFYLDNVFTDASIFENLRRQMACFFALEDSHPVKQSVRAIESASDYGWQPMFSEPSYQPGTVAHMESFDCGFVDADNRWPGIGGFSRDVRRYRDTLSQVATLLLEAIGEAAGLDSGFLPSRCESRELNTLRLLHYPENDIPQSDSNVGISAHTDFECITLISQSAPGLELTDVRGTWYDAPAEDGRIVVLLGDMLERWTNGYFKATGHRVRNTPSQRFSTVIFFAVDDGVVVQPLPQFVDEENPPRYDPVEQRVVARP